jgi:hypothetical protein
MRRAGVKQAVLLTFVLVALVQIVPVERAGAAGALDFSPQGTPSLGSFTPVVLDGSPAITSAALTSFSVTDTTASGAGWNLRFAMTQLTTGAHTLPAGSVTMRALEVQPASGNTATPPAVIDCVGVRAIDSAGGCPAAVADPASGDGLGSPGTWLFSPQPFVLSIPSDAYAGTYQSTFTVTLSSGP